ncbi:hypothetical protein VK792_01730 [Mesobacterium sp. TK19101]|uniref:Uncharacterized protein n=1 Tax=Mesobacterium hydrothermale TaxID=3111907 RepID=A0ABU6HCY6_9RHOB|nr:hypothetical protein [Mesobacterium sp. TK19101]MEC3859992.1 hypothetical protein [Mesobacterium sp. TK19101]
MLHLLLIPALSLGLAALTRSARARGVLIALALTTLALIATDAWLAHQTTTSALDILVQGAGLLLAQTGLALGTPVLLILAALTEWRARHRPAA